MTVPATANHAAMKLGRKPLRLDKRTLRMARYLTALPSFPDELPIPVLARLGMMDNDSLGDCTAAEKGHDIQVWTAKNGNEIVISDQEIVKFYSATTGYDRTDPSTDQGGDMVTVLNGFRNIGLTDPNGIVHKLGAYAAIDLDNHDHVKASVFLFGAVSMGVGLPISAQNQAVWDVAISGSQGDPARGSWGGHCVNVVAYNVVGPIVITWGAFKQMTWAWFDAYCEEAYALLSMQDWVNQTTGVTPSGLDITAMQSDLQAVAA